MTEIIAALRRFISRSTERGLPFFKTLLKEAKHFDWGAKQRQEFKVLKAYLTKLTTLSKPSPKAVLPLYLAASLVAVSAVLVEEKEHENKMRQFPMYFLYQKRSLEQN